MNIFLWVLQVLLAVHTAMGAVWKFSHSAEQTMPSLAAIPQFAWLGLAVLELFFAMGLVIPAVYKPLGIFAPIAACCIAAVMLAYCGLHLYSGATVYSPMVYWLVVAAFCAVIAYGRFVLSPFDS